MIPLSTQVSIIGTNRGFFDSDPLKVSKYNDFFTFLIYELIPGMVDISIILFLQILLDTFLYFSSTLLSKIVVEPNLLDTGLKWSIKNVEIAIILDTFKGARSKNASFKGFLDTLTSLFSKITAFLMRFSCFSAKSPHYITLSDFHNFNILT